MPRQRQRGIKGRGSVFQRKDGRWVGQFIVEETGKQKQVYANTEKEAWEKLDKALQEQKQGLLASGPKRKFGDFLTWWLFEVHKQKLRETSLIRYRSALRKHILPELGHIQLQKLTTQTLQQFYNRKAQEGQSPSSLLTFQKVIHNALDYAVRAHMIAYNPSSAVSLPYLKKRKVKPLTFEQAQQLLQAIQGSHLEMLITLAIATGMRLGELITLRWEDVDLEHGHIHIHRTGAYLGKNRFLEGETKTESGEREILIPQIFCERLKLHKARQEEQKAKKGEAWFDLGLVCCTSKNGKFFIETSVRRSFYRILDKAGLPRMHIHDLRHSAATLLREMGVDLKVIQQILGHSRLDTTANTYSHILPSMKIDAAEKMKKFLE